MTTPHPTVPLATWLTHLPALPLTSIELTAHYPTPAHFSDPVCTVARGLLGERLRDLRCLTRAPTCPGCPQSAACDYAQIFGGEAESAPGVSGAAQPYWIQGLPAAPALEPDSRYSIRLLATGPATRILPYLDVAFRDALARLGSTQATRGELSASRITPITLTGPTHPSRAWRIRALTPLVLRGDLDACEAACPQAPWLALLVRAGIRRLDALLRSFAGVVPPRAELPDLRAIVVREPKLGRWKGSRYSQRQGVRYPLDGLVGSAVVEGETMDAIGSLLSALAVTSVGASTSMGFGALSAEPVEPPR